jgi:hypothetical protein
MLTAKELLEVVRLGVVMRDAQRQYFKRRRVADLQTSKAAERVFDEAAARALQSDLFARMEADDAEQ